MKKILFAILFLAFAFNSFTQDTELKKNRDTIVWLLNESFKGAGSNDMIKRVFTRFSNDNLENHWEVVVDFVVNNEEANQIAESLAYNFLVGFVRNEKDKNRFEKSNFHNLVFKVFIRDKNYDKSYIEKTITKYNFERLQVPFSRKEIIDILE